MALKNLFKSALLATAATVISPAAMAQPAPNAADACIFDNLSTFAHELKDNKGVEVTFDKAALGEIIATCEDQTGTEASRIYKTMNSLKISTPK